MLNKQNGTFDNPYFHFKLVAIYYDWLWRFHFSDWCCIEVEIYKKKIFLACRKIDAVNMTLYWGLINKDKEGKNSGILKNWLSSKIYAVSSDAVSRFHCTTQEYWQKTRVVFEIFSIPFQNVTNIPFEYRFSILMPNTGCVHPFFLLTN